MTTGQQLQAKPDIWRVKDVDVARPGDTVWLGFGETDNHLLAVIGRDSLGLWLVFDGGRRLRIEFPNVPAIVLQTSSRHCESGGRA